MTHSNQLPPTAQSLPIVLLKARESVMAPIRNMLAKSNVTEQQWRILRVLSEHGPSDASTVAERASLLFPSLTRIAVGLERRRLITRHQNPTDKRRLVLEITSIGQAIIDDNRAEAVEIARQFETKLGKTDYDALLKLLQRLAE